MATGSPTSSSSGAAEQSPLSAAEGGRLMPQPPSTPKPARSIQIGLRHRFVNPSVGSLTTTVATRDNIEDFRGHEASDNDSCDSASVALTDSESGESSDEEGPLPRRGRGALPKSVATRNLAPVAECEVTAPIEDDSTDRLSTGSCSELDPCDLDRLLDEQDAAEPGPLLKLDEGVLPLARCPPLAWLRAAGFDTPGFDAAPVAPVCGERPTRYLDLFSRQLLARERTSDLTMGTLERHDKAVGRARHQGPLPRGGPAQSPSEVLAQNGEWLEAFIAKARAVPLHTAAEEVAGIDLGRGIASFLDHLSDASGVDASAGDEDLPDGRHVTGLVVRVRLVQRGSGRGGFLVDGEASIETPGRSQSPQPRQAPPPVSLEPPRPPLILGPLQPFSQRRMTGVA